MPHSRIERFLNKHEEQEIIDAILEAERDTSGEIRVHIEGGTGGDPYTRAKEVFHDLKMDNTRNSNGVLIYVAVDDHKFTIYGDEGIYKVVPPGFWDETRDIIESYFKQKAYKTGLVEGVLKAGAELKAHFPWNERDANELGNEISKG
jgi:uncharacterized membrane protein